jgi:predicted ArsR family transcriptional regulator
MSAEEIADILGVNTNSLRNRLTAMSRDGLVSIVGKRSKTTLYKLQPATNGRPGDPGESLSL